MDPPVAGKSVFSITSTPTVWIRRDLESFMASPLLTVELLLIFGSDVSNAFGEAPPPKQGFFIHPDEAFREWWISKNREPIPEGYVIPVLAAMQVTPNHLVVGKSTSIAFCGKN